MDGVLAELRTAHEGLSAAEAAARLARHGPNLLPQPRGPSLARQLFDQMLHFFAVMLWIASGLAFVGQMPQLGVAIIAVIVFRPPRSRRARLPDGRVLGRAFGFLGPVEATLSMSMLPLGAAVFFGWPSQALPRAGTDKLVLSTMVFASIALMQMAVALQCHGTPASLVSIRPFGNRLLNAALLVELAALAAFVCRVLGQHPSPRRSGSRPWSPPGCCYWPRSSAS